MPNGPNPQFNTETYTPDRRFAGSKDVVTDVVTVLSGQVLVAGALLGKITASGKYILSLSAAVDGSEVPRAITTQAIDATAGDKLGGVYLEGEFDSTWVTFGTAHTIASTKDALAGFGIHIKTPVAA